MKIFTFMLFFLISGYSFGDDNSINDICLETLGQYDPGLLGDINLCVRLITDAKSLAEKTSVKHYEDAIIKMITDDQFFNPGSYIAFMNVGCNLISIQSQKLFVLETKQLKTTSPIKYTEIILARERFVNQLSGNEMDVIQYLYELVLFKHYGMDDLDKLYMRCQTISKLMN